MSYYRSAELVWTPDSRHIVFLAEGVTDTQLYVFDTTARRYPARAFDQQIRKLMSASSPRLEQPDVHTLELVQIGAKAIRVRVSERGYPPGRNEGAMISRERTFTISFSPPRVS